MSKSPTIQARTRMYLRERRRLGFELRSMEIGLRNFARYVDRRKGHEPITIEVMTTWARQDRGHSKDPRTWARRLMMLRPFMRWLQQFEPATELPDETVFGRFGARVAPHVYREQEIVELLAAARRIGPELRGATYEALFGLIASTGLRISEAVRLRNADIDLKTGMLTVLRTKFAKSRHVPLHASTVEHLRRYRRIRDRLTPFTEETVFFVGSRGRRRGEQLSTRQVDRVFAALRVQLGWRNRGAHSTPRVHDLRHAFVVRRILSWHTQRVDIDQAMLALSTYVGHAKVSHTYWYLTGVPELMAVAAKKFEAGAHPEVSHA